MVITRCMDCDQYYKETNNAKYQALDMVISCGTCKLMDKYICASDPCNEIPTWCPKAMKAGADIGEPVYEIKKFEMPEDFGEENEIMKNVMEICTKVTEDEETFIFEHLRKYCEGVYATEGVTRIPKELLVRALTCFKEEHKDEWDFIMQKDKLKYMTPEEIEKEKTNDR